MNLFKRLKCFLGLHEPMKYVTVKYKGKVCTVCKNCGKLLEPPEKEDIFYINECEKEDVERVVE